MLNKSQQEILIRSAATGWVMEPDAKRLFALAGLPVPNNRWLKTREELPGLDLPWPVAAKIVSPSVVHKSEVGGVAIGLRTQNELEDFYHRMEPLPDFAGILVEELVAPGVELIIGAKTDKQFGPIILVGLGGITAELYDDVTIRLAPLDHSDVGAMIKKLKAGRLLTGFRGSPPIAMDQLSRVLIDFSHLVMDLAAEVASIDINPLICTPDGITIADARIMLA
ncbi:MAG: acetate--CoA ligase family protein [Proteobacteria bacterium]|nr:acetate--CoA ligase family protein [Pseudomonadota bacterium]MBU1686417.1 acetate--CoA ligase family protein [Pseudomonadota bacterium]